MTAWFLAGGGVDGKSPVQVLYDLGYDVWIYNSRGKAPSRFHTTLDPDSEAYWNFTDDEIGKFDIPAVLSEIQATRT